MALEYCRWRQPGGLAPAPELSGPLLCLVVAAVLPAFCLCQHIADLEVLLSAHGPALPRSLQESVAIFYYDGGLRSSR